MPSAVYSCVVDPSPKFHAQLRVRIATLVELAGDGTLLPVGVAIIDRQIARVNTVIAHMPTSADEMLHR